MSKRLILLAFSLAVVGCGESASQSSSGTSTPPAGTDDSVPSSSVGQPGSQDFGLFRQALDAGLVPGPELIDDMGFFAEHKLDYEPAACNGPVCLHGLVGVMNNMLNGADCTIIQLGMNSALDAKSLQRPSMHVVLVLDTSGSMLGEPIDYLKDGLLRMLDALEAGDTVSLVSYGSTSSVVLEHMTLTERIDLEKAIDGLAATGKTNIFAGLFDGYVLAERYAAKDVETRVILMSDGQPNEGIVALDSLRALVGEHARQGIGITTIGVGKDFGVDLMRSLSEAGSGNFYFLENPKAMVEVFSDEVGTFLAPIATDVRIEAALGAGYLLGDAYGTRGFRLTKEGGAVDIPVLFLGGRRSASDPITEGRRGGGGAILLELLRRREDGAVYDFVGRVTITYTDPATGKSHEQVVDLELPDTAAETIPEAGWFTDKTVEKGFVMLNLFAAFRLAAELARDADTGSAIGTLQAVRASVNDWLLDTEDADISDDLAYVDLFIAALKRQPGTPVVPASNPWPYD
jgi:Ca-activated chloride channel family protein